MFMFVFTTGTLTRSYQYDAAGNTLSDGARRFTYNGTGRLTSATRAGVTTNYMYNALGQRIQKANATGSTLFAYDEQGHLIGEYDQNGLVQELVWLDDIPVATLRTDQGGTNTGLFYIHTDHLNAPTKITRTTNNEVIWRWDHDPYGNGTPNEDPDGNGLTLAMNLRYPGQYLDSETGLYYNGARYYDPQIGRYVQSDPIGLAGGINTYAYVGGNPITYVDPWGLARCVYVISTHSMTCTSNDGKTMASSEQGIHSGLGPCKNNPGCENAKDLGPVPSDTYNISANTLPGRDGWWALQSTSWEPNVDGFLCRIRVKRCGFNIHLGTRSLGCITFDKDDPATVNDYKTLNDMFISDAPSNTLRVIPSRGGATGRW